MPGDSLGNTSGAERGSEDGAHSEIMEERPPADISSVASSNKDKLRGRLAESLDCAVPRLFKRSLSPPLCNHRGKLAGYEDR